MFTIILTINLNYMRMAFFIRTVWFGLLFLLPFMSKAEDVQPADSVAAQPSFLTVDAGEMERLAKDKDKYNELLNRFLNTDTTLTVEEVRDIYFGFSYTDKYSVSGDICPDADEALRNNKTKEALQLYKKQLGKSPVCASLLLRVHSITRFLEGDDSQEAKLLFRRMKMISHMIYCTGDGTSMETAFKVNWVADEYFMLKTFGYKRLLGQSIAQGSSSVGDKLQVDIDGKNYDFYFDLTRYFVKMNDMFK